MAKDEDKKSVGSKIAGGLLSIGKGIGRGLKGTFVDAPADMFKGINRTALGADQDEKRGLHLARDSAGRFQGGVPQWFRRKGRQLSAWNPANRMTATELQKARDEFNDVTEILRQAKGNRYLRNMSFELTQRTPLHTYGEAEASTKATFAQRPKPKGKETEETEEEKAARAKVMESYAKAVEIGEDEEVNTSLKTAQDRLSKKLEEYTEFKDGASYNPKARSESVHKAAVDQKAFIIEQATRRLTIKKTKTETYFKGLIDGVEAAATADDYPDDVKEMKKAGIIKVKTGDGARPEKEQIKEQLEQKQQAQIDSLTEQSKTHKDDAIKKAENLQNAYFNSLAQQVQMAQILRFQNRDKVLKAGEKGMVDDSADVSLRGGKDALEKGIRLQGDFLVDVAKEQDNVLKGPLGLELYYDEGSDAFVADLSDLNETQQQALIDFQAQVLFQRHGDHVNFTATSDTKDESKRVDEVQRTMRQQVRAVANVEGRSLENQTFTGIRKTANGVETVVYAQKPTGNQRPLSELFDADPQLKKEYTQLLANDKRTCMTAEERFTAMKADNGDFKSSHAPDQPAPVSGPQMGSHTSR